jgi:hypothetical protein
MREVADALTAAGVPTSVDPRNVNLPGGWLQRLTLTPDLLCGGGTLRLRVVLVAPDVGTEQALDILDDLLDAAWKVAQPNTGAGTTDRTILLPDSSTPYPATAYDVDYKITD